MSLLSRTLNRIILLAACATLVTPSFLLGQQTLSRGAIIRGDSTVKDIYLIFTGHEYADGADTIRAILKQRSIAASFFFTGDFLRDPRFRPIVRQLRDDGHYIGPHSDKHLLYCSWTDRDSLLVTKEGFRRDLGDNIEALEQLNIRSSSSRVFMPPFEWYNDSIAAWTHALGMTLVNFTPGTSSNADYTWQELGRSYVTTDSIFQRILRFEQRSPSGLNGFHLLLHIGVDPRRTDPFWFRLDQLLDELIRRGYTFQRFGL